MFDMIKGELMSGLRTKIGAALAKPAFKRVHKKVNADEYGGSPLLGVNGVTIIAHGGASAFAMKNALRTACEAITHEVGPHIIEAVDRHSGRQGREVSVAAGK